MVGSDDGGGGGGGDVDCGGGGGHGGDEMRNSSVGRVVPESTQTQKDEYAAECAGRCWERGGAPLLHND